MSKQGNIKTERSLFMNEKNAGLSHGRSVDIKSRSIDITQYFPLKSISQVTLPNIVNLNDKFRKI